MSNHHVTVSLLFIVKSPYLSLARAPPQHRCHLWAAPLPTHGSPQGNSTGNVEIPRLIGQFVSIRFRSICHVSCIIVNHSASICTDAELMILDFKANGEE